jgi:formamidopyrimidine-DNA glycosylase
MRRSIARGGTSLRDHVLPTGRAGDARRLIRAYGRAGLPCLACGSPMRGAAVAGRATAWCTRCQRYADGLDGSIREGWVQDNQGNHLPPPQ